MLWRFYHACLFIVVHDDIYVALWQRMVYQMRQTIRTAHQRLPRGDGLDGVVPALNLVTMATLISPGHPLHPNHPEPRVSPRSGRNAAKENTGAPTCAQAGRRDTWRPGEEHQVCEHQCLQGRCVMWNAVNQRVNKNEWKGLR